MQSQFDLFRVTPRIVPADREAEISISGRYPTSRLNNFEGELSIESVRADGLFTSGLLPGYTCGNGFEIEDRPMYEPVNVSQPDHEGIMRFRYPFCGTGEHTFRLKLGERVLGVFSIYSLPEELFGLRPFRGDMHVHSGYSGCNADPFRFTPEYMAATACSRGLDFISFSDHRLYFPSEKAAEFTRQCNGCFAAYPSEEVHLSDLHNIHLLNFGGEKAISCDLIPGMAEYDRELAEYLKTVPDFGDPWLQHMAANWHLIYDRIHKAGGLVVYCHPFWRTSERYFLPECIREYVFEKHLYDALELFGCTSNPETLDICDSRYREQCIAEGKIIPPLGNSDAHHINILGINTSVVFAKSNSLADLQQAVLAGNCIALAQYPDAPPRTAGNFALVSFWHFLKRNYYPRHDELCQEESRLLFQALENGSADAEYDKFIQIPYPQKLDGCQKLEKIKYAPDTAAFAALRSRRAELDKEFWG